MIAASLMLLAWAIEILMGWPNRLFRIVRHPVVWMGGLISLLDRQLNRERFGAAMRYALGTVSSLVVLGLVTAIALGISRALPATWWGLGIEALIASSLLASRSLYTHVKAVAVPLLANNISSARQAVSQIVGRSPDEMDEAAITRASLESLAENMSDGVVAPLFWGALFGLPGLAAYKAINTLDSMIGHRNETYQAFGGFAARLDDVANFIPARLSGVLIAMTRAKLSAFRIMLRDAGKHRSPNAGWPEAAMAGALDVRLSGPRTYGAQVSDEPWLNQGASDPAPGDVQRGLRVYVWALLPLALALVFLTVGDLYGHG